LLLFSETISCSNLVTLLSAPSSTCSSSLCVCR
jgi:hypothetical protein